MNPVGIQVTFGPGAGSNNVERGHEMYQRRRPDVPAEVARLSAAGGQMAVSRAVFISRSAIPFPCDVSILGSCGR
jgi:hypothetical protein